MPKEILRYSRCCEKNDSAGLLVIYVFYLYVLLLSFLYSTQCLSVRMAGRTDMCSFTDINSLLCSL